MNIVLKSASPRRYDLLKAKGYDFEVKVYDIDETMDSNKTPYENVKEFMKKQKNNRNGYFSFTDSTNVLAGLKEGTL